MTIIPALPGAYAVQFYLSPGRELSIGRLGVFYLPTGAYLYLGSARGSGGLLARLGRHIAGPPTRCHWHVDRLHAISQVKACCYVLEQEIESIIDPGCSIPAIECVWSQALADLPSALIPAPGFGASDCQNGCCAHLVAFPHNHPTTAIPQEIKKLLAEAAQIPKNTLVCMQVEGFYSSKS